jgi:hypothetical protein
MVGLAIAGGASDEATAAGLPKDVCTLLKPGDIQALAPGAKIGNGVLTNNAPLGATCAYKWGPRTNEWGETYVHLTVVDTSKAWPGGFDVKQRILGEMRAGGQDASEIPGIGEGAVFTTNPKSYSAKAKAYLVKAKGALLEVEFHGGNAAAQRDKLIVILKTAAAAL